MRSRLLAAVAAPLALLGVPAGAQAAAEIGISENQPAMFGDPLFQQLGTKKTRLVVSYDVVARGGEERDRVDSYIGLAQAQGVEVLVSFQHSRGDTSRCAKRDRRKRQCRLPSQSAYKRAVRAFLQRYPSVKTISPWNEANHFTQPTAKSPRAAARFTDIARRECRGCTIVAVDVLDQADNTKAKRPTFRKTARWIKTFRRALRSPRTICGVHNYSDTNRFRSTGTRALIRALGCREIWLTETGGIYKFGSFKPSERRQLKATKYLFDKIVKRNRKIDRVYVYHWFGDPSARFDAGLVSGGQPRRAYREVAKRAA